MRAPRIPADEQFRLIMECRASGLTDHEWCLQNDINPGIFYNWVKRLRQKECAGIPNAMRNPVPHKQEIVKIQLAAPDKKGNSSFSCQESERPVLTTQWSNGAFHCRYRTSDSQRNRSFPA
jgi:transposase-like protein